MKDGYQGHSVFFSAHDDRLEGDRKRARAEGDSSEQNAQCGAIRSLEFQRLVDSKAPNRSTTWRCCPQYPQYGRVLRALDTDCFVWVVGGIALKAECHRDVEEGDLAHGMAEHEAEVVMHGGEFLSKLVGLFFRSPDLISAHAFA